MFIMHLLYLMLLDMYYKYSLVISNYIQYAFILYLFILILFFMYYIFYYLLYYNFNKL